MISDVFDGVDMALTEQDARWELRRCKRCHREGVRPKRDWRRGEVPCICGGRTFDIYHLILEHSHEAISPVITERTL